MCKLTLVAGLCLIIASFASSTRLVCYYNSVAANRGGNGMFTVSDIDPNLCTHLIYAFAGINDQNELVPSQLNNLGTYGAFNQLKARNPQLKTLLAVGGLFLSGQKFSSMGASLQKRSTFIQSAITLLRNNRFDGLNLDWRYPGGPGSQSGDKQSFTMLCKEFKEAFVAEAASAGRVRLLLTASVSAEKAIIDVSYDVPQISTYLDFINVLTFDFHGPWENVTGHHSPLFRGSQDTGNNIELNTDSAMRNWRNLGAPADKLNLGLAAYGRAFDLSTHASGVGAPASGPGEEGCFTGEAGFWATYEICLYTEGVTPQLISDQQVPYAVTEGQWVGYDDKASLTKKVNYLKTNNFGGAFVWSVDLDDKTGAICKMGGNPFITELHDLLVPGFPGLSSTTPPATTTTTTPTTTTTTPTTTTTTIKPTTTTTTIKPTTTTTTPTTTTTTIKPTTTTTTPTTTTTTIKPTTTTTTIKPTTTTTTPTTTTTTIKPTTTTTTPTTTTTTIKPTTTTTTIKPTTTTTTIKPTTTTTTPTTTTTTIKPTTTTTTFKPTTTTTTPTTTTTTIKPTTTTTTIKPTTTTTTPTTTTTTIKPTTTTTTTPVPPTPSISQRCLGNPGLYFAYPNDPTRFIQCGIQGVFFIHSCPTGLTFNEAVSVCTIPTNIIGSTSPTPVTTTTTTTIKPTTTTTTIKPTTTTTTIKPTTTTTTIKPTTTTTTIKPTTTTTTIKPTTTTTTIKPTTTTTTIKPTTTTTTIKPTTTTTTIKPTTTTTTIKPTTTTTTIKPTTTTTTTPVPPTPSISQRCRRSPGLYFAYPNDPTRFIQCGIQGAFFIHSCPTGLTFNEAVSVCTF